MSTKRHIRPAFFLVSLGAVGALACGIVVQRDLSAIPPGQIGFDDMCGLQDYFDSLEAKVSKPPAVASSLDLEGGDGIKTVRGGKAKLVFEGDFLVKNAKRVLKENYSRLPEALDDAKKIEIEVRWVEKAGIKRVTTDQESELFVGDDSAALPYHPCLSEFLFGEPLYKQRREMWGQPIPGQTVGNMTADEDAGVSTTNDVDARAHE
ncbi:MAG: hypothetical protein JWM82_676 [Myxococcales bacterium]|nr:hypothetical protein [Myxococcales bacterium]